MNLLCISNNGAGLGHLTRLMAIARRLPAGSNAIFATMSLGLAITRRQGYFAEYLPSAKDLQLSHGAWNRWLAGRLLELIALYRPAVVVFDGTAPTRALLQARRARPALPFVWCRRGLWKPEASSSVSDVARAFDLVIEPGEFAAALDQGATSRDRARARAVAPILYLDPAEADDRAAACAAIGARPERRNLLVQLGAGNINDIGGDAERIAAALGREVDLFLAQSPIAEHRHPPRSEWTIVEAYPLARHLAAFDAVITACGYNSFHECLAFAKPALYLPNPATMTDDQTARARHAAAQGVGLMLARLDDAAALDAALARLLDPAEQAAMQAACRAHHPGNGAAEAARLITALAR